MSKRIMPVLFILVVACVAKVFVGIEKSKDVFSDLPVSGKIIIIDPGHGGWDPGKAGLNGEDEKEINLKIAERIRDYLEQGGAFVYLTRQDDSALGKTKNEDMKKTHSLFKGRKRRPFYKHTPERLSLCVGKGRPGVLLRKIE